MILVADTSVLVDFLRGRRTPAVERLIAAEEEGHLTYIPVVCCQELLQGARDEPEWNSLVELLSGQPLLTPEDPWRSHQEAARIYFDCRRKGISPRSSVDCLIAQLVLEADGVLLHDDADFERMKEVRPLRTVQV